MKTQPFYNSPTDLGYQGKKHGGGCFTVTVLLICLIAVALFGCNPAPAQTKPSEIKPSVRLEQPEILAIISKLDSSALIITRSDAVKIDRNRSTDMLLQIRMFLIGKFEQQNKQDSVKVIEAKGKGAK